MAKSETGRGSDQFVVRMPDGMRDRIAKAARENKRSMNAEIVARLADTFEQEDHPELNGLQIILNSDGMPISWTEITEHIYQLNKAGKLSFFSQHVLVFTPELVDSKKRIREALEIEKKYRALTWAKKGQRK